MLRVIHNEGSAEEAELIVCLDEVCRPWIDHGRLQVFTVDGLAREHLESGAGDTRVRAHGDLATATEREPVQRTYDWLAEVLHEGTHRSLDSHRDLVRCSCVLWAAETEEDPNTWIQDPSQCGVRRYRRYDVL